MNPEVLVLLKRAAELAKSVHENHRESGWCEDVEADIRKAISLLSEPQFTKVVTRYGGHQHLGVEPPRLGYDRWTTACLGTSAWTVESWEKVQDHPLLSIEQIKALPPCPRCMQITGTRIGECGMEVGPNHWCRACNPDDKEPT